MTTIIECRPKDVTREREMTRKDAHASFKTLCHAAMMLAGVAPSRRLTMKMSYLAATILTISAFSAHAETNSLTGKAMQDLIAKNAGFTVAPAVPITNDTLIGKVQRDLLSGH
jgi:hypothetical protein